MSTNSNYEDVRNDKELLEALQLIKDTDISYHPKLLIGKSRPMLEIKAIIDQVASTDITVLLGGESGTGKELVARSIFKQSLRKDKPFVKILCAAIPDGLLESELFGHEKGSFTGAHAKKPGKFEFAQNGTIFLDEIGEIPFSLQAKLLQVIQDREFTRIGGGNEMKKVNVRIIVATNKNLEDEVEKGNFREDLFYRLNVVNITLPPLRDRLNDLPMLIELFMEKYKKTYNKPEATITPGIITRLMNYHWPGNVRELENIIKRIVVLGENHIVLKKPKAASVNYSNSPNNYTSFNSGPEINRVNPANNDLYHGETEDPPPHYFNPQNIDGQNATPPIQNAYSDTRASHDPKEGVTRTTESSFFSMIDDGASLKDVARRASLEAERSVIQKILTQTHWNRKEAAKKLHISYKALLYKIKECGLEEDK